MALTYRPDIEGLRALAIVPVVVFHAFPSLMPGGYVGVDVFLVISGFLITSLLLDRLRAGSYSVASFYGARIRRIFPALFVMLALTVPLSLLLPSSWWVQAYGRTLGATALFFSNMEFYRTTDYFETAADLKPLVHTWSLAVEEQYYIVFPVFLALLYRRWPRALAPALALVGAASLALSVRWLQTDPALAFFASPSRTFELMMGSLLAVGFRGDALPRAWRETAAAVGLGLILLSCGLLTPRTPFPGLTALLPCLGAAMLIWAGKHGSTFVGRMVASEPLRWIGAMSFSLYLWHWPMLVLTRHWTLGEPSPWQAGAAVGAAVLLAWLSLKWVESPVRRAGYTDRHLLVGGAACILLTLLVAWVLVERTWWLRPTDRREQALLAGVRDSNPHRLKCHGRVDFTVPYEQRCRFGDASKPADTVVWADSHGAELALAMGEAAGRVGRSVAQITSSTCPPALHFEEPTRPMCTAHNAATLRALVDDVAVKRVVMVAHYRHYLRTQAEAFSSGLSRSVAALVAAGKRVVIVGPFPTYAYPVPAALVAMHRRGEPLDRFGQPRHAYERDHGPALTVLRQLGTSQGVSVVDVGEVLCGDGDCDVVSEGVPLYYDDNHLSMVGARLLSTKSTALGPH